MLIGLTASTRQRLTVLLAPPLAAGGLAVVSGPEVSLPLLGSAMAASAPGGIQAQLQEAFWDPKMQTYCLPVPCSGQRGTLTFI